jgi:hypothetical protein
MEDRSVIEPMFEVFYLESIKYAAERANAAFERFDDALIRGEHNGLVVANVQEAMTHIGELSRIFWPSRDNRIFRLRADQLRVAFGLDDTSLLKNRELRDALEHFDERLDIYLKSFPVGQLITEPIVGLIDQLSEPIRIFRMVDPQRSTFVMLDEKYEFGELREIAKSLQEKTEEMLKNGGRLS